jgi:hypothetical protein
MNGRGKCKTCKFKNATRVFDDGGYFSNCMMAYKYNHTLPDREDYYYNVTYCHRFPKKEQVSDDHSCGEYKLDEY